MIFLFQNLSFYNSTVRLKKKKKSDRFQQCEREYPKGLINNKKIIQILNVLIKSCWVLTVLLIWGPPWSLFYCLELPVQGTVTLSLLINYTAPTKWLRSESSLVLQKCLDWPSSTIINFMNLSLCVWFTGNLGNPRHRFALVSRSFVFIEAGPWVLCCAENYGIKE